MNSKVHPVPRVLKKECELVIIAKALSCLLLGWPKKFVCSMNTLFIIVTGENKKPCHLFLLKTEQNFWSIQYMPGIDFRFQFLISTS